MKLDNVIVVSKKEKIIIKLEEKANIKEIIKSLEKKLPELKKLYKDEKNPIEVVGKILKNAEMDEIQKIIQEQIDVQVDFEIPKTLGLHSIKKAFNKEIQDSKTKFIKGSLRSGQRIEYEGSIVIIGDVNGGAEVIAEENIIILGILRGLAHAGAKGNKNAIIAANRIDCPQIRIANIIKENEQSLDDEYEYKNYAYVSENNEIFFE